uniref:thermonuclease family protein n=1 Tax=Litoribacterium kuwaitense TaxID=1398745 RepID=UPI001BA5CC26|nr:thermonuclease family protein [Litoribacterium kuwaitense]
MKKFLFTLCVLPALLIGCSQADDRTEKNTSVEEREQSPLVDAEVTRVVDGDTIEVSLEGKEESIRLLLVDTPETKHPNLPVQAFGPEASQFATDTLEGEAVQLEYDGPKRDKYDRLLAYIWIDGQNFNQMLLDEGLARFAYVYDPPYTHQEAFIGAEEMARATKKGIWSIEGYATEDGFDMEKVESSEKSLENEKEEENDQKEAQTASTPTKQNLSDLPYDPFGPDRDCNDFSTQAEAQRFFEAAGGPEEDPHRLDGDNNGIVCESL